MIEIGSGYSTRIAHKALQPNQGEGRPGKLTCIDPFPEARLTEAKLDIDLIQRPVESLELDLFSQLQSGDILFIDSSHAVKFGGDVCREFLEILPSLRPGVWIHVHDIFFPHDYPAEWLIEKRIAFSEQYLLKLSCLQPILFGSNGELLAWSRSPRGRGAPLAALAPGWWTCQGRELLDEEGTINVAVAEQFQRSPGSLFRWYLSASSSRPLVGQNRSRSARLTGGTNAEHPGSAGGRFERHDRNRRRHR